MNLQSWVQPLPYIFTMSFSPLFPLIPTIVGVQSRGRGWEELILSLFYWHRISGLTQKSKYFVARYYRTSQYRYVLLSIYRYHATWQARFRLQSSKQSNWAEDSTASSCRRTDKHGTVKHIHMDEILRRLSNTEVSQASMPCKPWTAVGKEWGVRMLVKKPTLNQ